MSSVGGVLASVAWAEAPVVVGASAGILGLAGGLWVSRGWGSAAVRARVALVSTRGLGITLALMVGLGFVVPMIAQAGHLGGLAFGLVLGGVLASVGPTQLRPVGLLAAIGGLVLVSWLAHAPKSRPNYFAFRGYAALDAGDEGMAVELLRSALELEGGSPELQNGVAYALVEAGVELGEALVLVESALEQDAENPDYLDTKGWLLCRRGQVEEGMGWLRRASAASEGSVEEIELHLQQCAEPTFHVEQ